MVCRLARAVLIAATLLGGAIAAIQTVETRASVQIAAKDRCKRYERHALLQDTSAVVVWIREFEEEPELPLTLSTCRRRDGEIGSLDSPIDRTTAFPPPAITLVGGKVAYALQIGPTNAPDDPGRDEYVTVIMIRDIQTNGDRYVFRVGPARLMKIGSLVLSARGSVAWIACPEPHREPERARFGPTCDRRGALDYVYVQRAGESRPRRVGAGRKIDPNSLKRMGDAITWREGRGWKRARFR